MVDISGYSCKAELVLCHDEVWILIFDDPAEQEDWKRPQFRSAEVYSNTKFSNTYM